jgi:hypothetical protein
MKATATVLAKIDDQRFQRAMIGLRQGAYHVKIAFRGEDEVRGFVQCVTGQVYGCTISNANAFCSCPDALYRGHICKHIAILALSEIRDAVSHPSTPPAHEYTKEKTLTETAHGQAIACPC